MSEGLRRLMPSITTEVCTICGRDVNYDIEARTLGRHTSEAGGEVECHGSGMVLKDDIETTACPVCWQEVAVDCGVIVHHKQNEDDTVQCHGSGQKPVG